MGNIRKKIIVVDDVNFTHIMVKQVLRDYYEVYSALSAAKLFEILEHVMPDLILLDINMPEVNGYETIKRLKADPRLAEIPIILLTASRDEDSVVKGISLGVVGHITKPVSADLLLESINNQLNPNKRRNPSQDAENEEYVDKKGDADKPCILAVDDSPSMLRAINYALRDKYKVYMLAKPENIKKSLEKITPDLFLLDYQMPVLNGFELIPIIREFPEHKKTPIVFLTSEGTADHLTFAINCGAADFIVKPFDTATLIKKIDKHILR